MKGNSGNVLLTGAGYANGAPGGCIGVAYGSRNFPRNFFFSGVLYYLCDP